MKLTTSAIILGFIAAAKAELPDIAAITSVDPSSFPSYQTGGLIRQGSNVSNLVTRQDCPNGQSGDGNCCATAPILTWVSKRNSKFWIIKLTKLRETLIVVGLASALPMDLPTLITDSTSMRTAAIQL
jgi:hypothetical protein